MSDKYSTVHDCPPVSRSPWREVSVYSAHWGVNAGAHPGFSQGGGGLFFHI